MNGVEAATKSLDWRNGSTQDCRRDDQIAEPIGQVLDWLETADIANLWNETEESVGDCSSEPGFFSSGVPYSKQKNDDLILDEEIGRLLEAAPKSSSWDAFYDEQTANPFSESQNGRIEPAYPAARSRPIEPLPPMTPESTAVTKLPGIGNSFISLPKEAITCHSGPTEDEEFHERRKVTGTVGRLVRYTSEDLVTPCDDILGLKGGLGVRVVVTALRQDGVAARAGVSVGDELVSVDGRRDFVQRPAAAVLASLRTPVTLVFTGFVGKLQAEVRLDRKELWCGLRSGESVANGREVHVADEVVFRPQEAPLFLVSENNGNESLYELRRYEARNLVQRALLFPSAYPSSATSGKPSSAGISNGKVTPKRNPSPRTDSRSTPRTHPNSEPRVSIF